jgi:putative peptidoglycan lipid II flippase
MVFAAVDFPLNYAFYARNNTLLPALVGVASVGVYVAAALALVGPLGFIGLVWADTAKQAAHALVMAALLGWAVGALGAGVRRGLAQIAVAAAIMAATTALLSWALRALTVSLGAGAVDHWSNDLLQVLIAGGGGLLAYVAVLWRLRFEEVLLVWRRVRGGV